MQRWNSTGCGRTAGLLVARSSRARLAASALSRFARSKPRRSLGRSSRPPRFARCPLDTPSPAAFAPGFPCSASPLPSPHPASLQRATNGHGNCDPRALGALPWLLPRDAVTALPGDPKGESQKRCVSWWLAGFSGEVWRAAKRCGSPTSPIEAGQHKPQWELQVSQKRFDPWWPCALLGREEKHKKPCFSSLPSQRFGWQAAVGMPAIPNPWFPRRLGGWAHKKTRARTPGHASGKCSRG